MKFIIISVILSASLIGCSSSDSSSENNEKNHSIQKISASQGLSAPKELVNNKDRALAFYELISNRDAGPAVNMISSELKMSNWPMGSKYSELKHFLKAQASENSKIRIKPLRAGQMGNSVFVHSIYAGLNSTSAIDILTFEKGKIVNIEHYSETYQEKNSKGIPTMEGQSKTLEVNKTGLYLGIVKSFMKKVAIDNSPNDILEGVNDDYLDHSAYVDGAGSTSLENRFVYDENSKTAFKFDYHKMERIQGEGNFVLVESKATLNSEDVTVLDLFRLNRNRISEHWDVVSK